MLLLGSRTITVEGVTVFPDHADPDQFWYLPGPVQLARRPDGDQAFTFIKYKPAAVAAGAKGGGFLMFQVDLRLEPDLERRIVARLRSIAKGRPRLTVVPFDEGTVQAIALNLQGSGGTSAQPAPEGSFRAVEQILGASTPSLQGNNTAAFSLTLSQEGAIILEKAFEQGTAPVGVLYDLKFTGMRPALHVEINADLERVYNQFGAALDAQVYFVQAGIDAAFEKLVQNGAIQIKVIDFVGGDDQADKEKWALDFFKENLLRQWFEPTLTPGQVAGGRVTAEPLSAVLARGNALRPPTTPAPARPATGAPGAGAPAAAPPRAAPPTANTGSEDPTEGHNPVAPPADPTGTTAPTEGTGTPPASSLAAAAAAVGAPRVTPPSQPATTPPNGLSQPPAGGGSSAVVSFRLRAVHQEERKRIKVVYDRSEATQRSYAPQGFFGVLVAGLDRSRHFVEVDLDDAFFRVFQIVVDPPDDFAGIGLRSAQVALDYGDPAKPAELKHKDLRFEPGATPPSAQTMEVFLNSALDLDYRQSVQYHFATTSGWEGSKFSYELPASSTEDRTLVLVPHEHIGFLSVDAVATRVDWSVVDSIDVHLRHESGGEVLEKQLLLTAATPSATWKVRTSAPNARDYTWRLVHHLADGTTKETVGTEPSRASLLPVDDPFPGSITLSFLPLLDPAKTRLAFVDIEYHDEEGNYHREERLTMKPSDTDPQEKQIAVMDLKKKSYTYQITLVGTNNSMTRLPPVTTSDDLIAVSEPLPA
ncbi:hypothetical protein [Micropruina sp.]|uniref:hypothetical protein n=1 Tax=Micropruina sp. TaxID=2737536 RepID=UPI0039E50C1C